MNFQEISKMNASILVGKLISSEGTIQCFSKKLETTNYMCNSEGKAFAFASDCDNWIDWAKEGSFFLESRELSWVVDSSPDHYTMCSGNQSKEFISSIEEVKKTVTTLDSAKELVESTEEVKSDEPSDWCFWPDVIQAAKNIGVELKVQANGVVSFSSTQAEEIQHKYDMVA